MNSDWKVRLKRQPEKILRRIPRTHRERIRTAIRSLANNPYLAGSVKFEGFNDLYRIRVGDWRIVYAVDNDELIILVVRIAPRGNVYRNL